MAVRAGLLGGLLDVVLPPATNLVSSALRAVAYFVFRLGVAMSARRRRSR